MDSSLRHIVRQVAEAQNFDSVGNYKDAYIKYLQSTQNVIQQLLENVATAPEIRCDSSTKKMVNVGVMCMQRAEDLLTNKIVPNRQSSITSSTDQNTGNKHNSFTTVLPLADDNDMTSCGIPFSSVESLSPVELAERQNRQIMSAYRARMSGLSRQKATDLSLSLQRRLAENIAIGKAREKALAKKRQERRVRLEAEVTKRFSTTTIISKDELERRELYTKALDFEHENVWLLEFREKLKEEPENCTLIEQLVHKVLRTTSHPLTQLLYKYQNKIYDVAQTLLKQWNCSYEMTENGQTSAVASNWSVFQSADETTTTPVISTSGASELLDKSLDSSQRDGTKGSSVCGINSSQLEDRHDNPECSQFHDDSRPEVSCAPLEMAPASSGNCDEGNHSPNQDPAASGQNARSSISLQELDREAILHHLAIVAGDTQDYLEKLVTMFIVVYESLDHAIGRDCCYASIAEVFYKPVWGPILSLFRVVYKKEENRIADVMCRYRNSSPVDLQIPRKFCLLPEDSLLMPEGYQPYLAAISELQTIVKAVSPLTKLECIVRVSRAICQCVEEFYTNNCSDVPNIGADDLLPMLSYVLIKANIPQIYAECQALEELVHEGYLMGEEGYCLTSLDTAMKYVMSL